MPAALLLLLNMSPKLLGGLGSDCRRREIDCSNEIVE